MEAHAATIIKRIIKNNNISTITDEDSALLSRFFALQFVRTQQWREMWKHAQDSFAEAMGKKGINTQEIEGFEEQTEESIKEDHMRSIYKSDDFVPHFYLKTWVLLMAN